MSDVSIVRPSGPDSSAQTLHAWAQDTVNDVNASSHKLRIDLTGLTVTRPAVEGELSSAQAVFFFGHGDWDGLLNRRIVVVDTNNIGKAVGKIIFAIACKSAHTLGDAAQKVGVHGYLGFDEDIIWVTGVSRQMTGIACTAGAKQLLLNQGTLSDAANAMRQEFDNIIRYFKYGAGKSNANATLTYLWADWDKNHIRIKGNASARL